MNFSFVSDPPLQPMFDNSTKLNIGSTEISRTWRAMLNSDVEPLQAIPLGSSFIVDYIRTNAATYQVCGGIYWKSIDVKQVGGDGKPIYEITITYDNTGQEYNQVDPDNSVIAENAQYRWGTTTVQMGMEYDIDGNKITTSTGEPFVQVLEQEEYKVTYSVTKSVNLYNFSVYVPYLTAALGSVNIANVKVASHSLYPVWFYAGCALFKNYTADAVYTADFDVWYYRVTCEFEVANPVSVNTAGGAVLLYSDQRAVLDQGTYYYDEAGNKQVFRVAGETSQQPGNLNGNSGKLADGANPVFLIYNTRPRLDWDNIIGLIN